MKGIVRSAIVLAFLVASLAAPAPAMAAGPPINDNWATAPVISAVPYSDIVDTTQATTTDDTYNFCGGGSYTVWYRLELAATARVEISTAGSDYDTVIDLYGWDEPPGAFENFACDDNGGPGETSKLVHDLGGGRVYAVMVSSPSGQPGGLLSFAISSVPPPANDDFEMATGITVVPFSETIDVGAATSVADDPASSCGGQGPSVWYDFSPVSAGRYEISTQGSNYDTLATVYTGLRGALSELSCNDNYMAIGSYQARLRFDAVAGTTYRVGITWGGGQYPPAGILTLAVGLAPAAPVNDHFDAATRMTSLPFGEDLDTSEATTAPDDPTPSCSDALPATVWYTITPTTSDRISFGVRGADFGPTVALYQGTRGALTELACANGATIPGFELDPQPGTTYYLQVGGATAGAGQLRVEAKLAFVVRLTITGGKVDARSGIATISGTISCNQHSFVSTNSGELQQKIGRHTVRGSMGVFTECHGTLPWTSTVTGDSGPFIAGKATAKLSLFGYASETGEISQPVVTKSITLKATP